MHAMSVEKGTSETCAVKDSRYHPRINFSTSVNSAIPKRETSLRRTNELFRSRYLSVTDLLQRVELQSKVSAKLFPLIDKEKYQKNKLSTAESEDSFQDIADYIGPKGDLNDEPIPSNLCSDAHNNEGNTLLDQTNQRTEINKRYISALENPSGEISSKVTLVSRALLPPKELLREYADATRASIGCSTLFGVHTEYMAFSNRLKVSINRFGNLPSRYGKKRHKVLIAKLCLLPGNTHKQKVRVTNCLNTSLDKYSAYLKQSCATDLTQKKIGVSVYIKNGFFKRQNLIYRWTVPLENFDFIEPQTAWKNINWSI